MIVSEFKKILIFKSNLYSKSAEATLANLGNTLANQMKEITKDFRLAFGSFIDKEQIFTLSLSLS